MASRQSQLHSYQFATQRTVSALVTRDPDPAQPPFRRVGGSVFASLMVAILALGAVGIYGLIVSGGNTTWRAEGAVVVERESGAKFVYLNGQLHPVLNYASALLASGSTDPKPISVSRRSLAGAPRGTPLGIPGAPDSLAEPGKLLGAPWTVCSNQVRQPDGTSHAQSSLLVGARPATAHPLAPGEALIVRTGETEYMIWNAHKFRIPADDQRIVHDAIGVHEDQPVPAATALLNVIAPGVDLGRVRVPGTGPSKVAGMAVGDRASVSTPGVGVQNFVALADGLAQISQLQANLMASAGSVAHDQPPSWLAVQPRSKLSVGSTDPVAALPDRPPTVVTSADGQRAVCAVFSDASGLPEIAVNAAPPAVGAAAVTGSQSPTSAVLADRVLVAPGRGAVVLAVPSPDATTGTLCLVTDLAVAFPVASTDALATLGYAGVQPPRLPDAVVALLQRGPVLDQAAAQAPAVLR